MEFKYINYSTYLALALFYLIYFLDNSCNFIDFQDTIMGHLLLSLSYFSYVYWYSARLQDNFTKTYREHTFSSPFEPLTTLQIPSKARKCLLQEVPFFKRIRKANAEFNCVFCTQHSSYCS